MRNLGASFGTAITTWLWTREATKAHAVLVENTHVYSPATADYLQRLQQLGLSEDAAHAFLENMITVQSYTLATDRILTISATLMLSLITLVWWARPPFVASRGH
jgi:DHA2 family multidrug resistance protein